MAISDKTRKTLWGRSGNRCAVCRHELVIEGTQVDDESVVGDECHIVSGKENGPRYIAGFPASEIDEQSNLILLCRGHHKMVDDQSETYTVEVLSKLKANHEKWVSASLTEEKPIPPVRISRIEENIPTHLVQIASGQDLFNILDGSMGYQFDHDAPSSDQEVKLLSNFFQNAQDWGDLVSNQEAGERVKTKFIMNAMVKTLEDAGFLLFGTREIQRVEGGVGAPSSFPITILRAVRATNPEIRKINVPNNKTEA